MNHNCSNWKDALLEAALTENIAGELQGHLSHCSACTQKLAILQTRRERMDEVLPLLASHRGPSPQFQARVLAAAEAQHPQRNVLRRPWLLAAAAVMMAVIVMVMVHRSTVSSPTEAELAAAQKLAQWHAPSDALLAVPGQEILRNVPKLGESYLKSSMPNQ